MTCRLSIPGLMTLRATWRCTGWVCSARKTVPMPPSPSCWSSLYGPITVPGPAPRGGSAMVGAAAGASRKLPVRWCCSSNLSRRSRRAGLPAHTRSRKAARSAGTSFSRASMKRDCSCMAVTSTPLRVWFCISMRRWAAQCAGNPEEKIRPGERRQALPFGFAKFFQQPGTGIGPDLIGLARRDAEETRGLGVAEPREVTELDEFGSVGVGQGQFVEGLVQRRQQLQSFRRIQSVFVEFQPDAAAAVLQAPLPPSRLDEDTAHGLGRGREEVPAAVPVLGLLHVNQTQVGLVDEGSGLQGLAGRLLGEFRRRQSPQFLVDQGEELLGGVGVALFDGRQDVGKFAHGWQAASGY